MVLEEELEQVRRLCHTKVKDSKLVTCTTGIIRVEISKSKERTVICMLQFPDDYPNHEVLIELRSKTLDGKLLEGLTKICEEEARKYLGERQVLLVLKFLSKFLDENPLCCCFSEVSSIKKTLLKDKDSVKVKQKDCALILKVIEGNYTMVCNLQVPINYPEHAVKIQLTDSNFPTFFCRVFVSHAMEIGRRCVEPPLNKKKMSKNSPPFQPKPSLLPVCTFLLESIHRYPKDKCP